MRRIGEVEVISRLGEGQGSGPGSEFRVRIMIRVRAKVNVRVRVRVKGQDTDGMKIGNSEAHLVASVWKVGGGVGSGWMMQSSLWGPPQGRGRDAARLDCNCARYPYLASAD